MRNGQFFRKESTMLGYGVTMVKHATADFSVEEMHAALDINIPNYASAMVTTTEIVDSIASL